MPLNLRLGNNTILVFRERKNGLDRNEKICEHYVVSPARADKEQMEHELVIHESHTRRQMFCSRRETIDCL